MQTQGLVKHTPQERALYLSAAADARVGNTLQRNQRLLILCSHFSDQLHEQGEESAKEARK